MFATKEEVIIALRDGGTCVANTLAEEMCPGEAGVFIDGHITESVNHPMTDLMNGHGLPANLTLEARFREQMQGDRLITYCGDGMAATLNACVAKLIGVKSVAVYDGSISEWLTENCQQLRGRNPENFPDPM